MASIASSAEPPVPTWPSTCREDPGFRFAAWPSECKATEPARCFLGERTKNCPGQSSSRIGELLHGRDDTSPSWFEDKQAAGKDHFPARGVDGAQPLIFYVGHGRPDSWDIGRSEARLASVHLGNEVDGEGGKLRYLLMCACNAMAHGPSSHYSGGSCDDCGPEVDFPYPERFVAGRRDRCCYRNVFERWKHALGPDVRMVCGGSSRICTGLDQIAEFWPLYDSGCVPVADAFLRTFHESDRVPLCIARGGEDPTTSALYDKVLTDEPAGFGEGGGAGQGTGKGGYLHVQYPVRIDRESEAGAALAGTDAGRAGSLSALVERLQSRRLPVLELARPGIPGDADPSGTASEWGGWEPWVGELEFQPDPGGRFWVAEATIEGALFHVWTDVASGGLFARREDGLPPRKLKDDERCTSSAPSALEGRWREWWFLRPEERDDAVAFGKFHLQAMYVDSTERSDPGGTITRYCKGAVASLRRALAPCTGLLEERCAELGLENISIPVVGPGGVATLELGPDIATPVAVSSVWRPLSDEPTELLARVLPFEDAVEKARTRARELVGGPLEAGGLSEDPELEAFGYKEEDSHCRQRHMWLVYVFRFPALADIEAEYGEGLPVPPPLTVEVPGQLGVPETACLGSTPP